MTGDDFGDEIRDGVHRVADAVGDRADRGTERRLSTLENGPSRAAGDARKGPMAGAFSTSSSSPRLASPVGWRRDRALGLIGDEQAAVYVAAESATRAARQHGQFRSVARAVEQVADRIAPADGIADGIGRGVIAGLVRPEYGPGIYDLCCSACQAGWCGVPDEPCFWCERAVERQRDEQRRMLLDPPHLRTDEGSPRFDSLSDLDKRIWRRTRGQTRDEDSLRAWRERLANAIRAGVVTKHEARAAVGRVERRGRP